MSELKCQEEVDDELFRDLLSLTKNMDIEPKRNELCYCMSGKKYKKCCMDKEKQSDAEFVELKEFYLAPDVAPEVFQYDMSDEDYHVGADCYEMLLTGDVEEDPEAIELLSELLEKYPTHPVLHNVQALRYLMKGENEAFEKTIQRNLEEFPDSRMNHLLLKYHEYDSYASRFFPQIEKKVEEVLPQDPELKKTYDEERVPLTEFLLTLSLQIYETLFEDKLHRAMHLKEMMVDILEQMEWEDHFLLARVEQLLIVAKFMRRVKIFLANYSGEETDHHGAVPINA